MFVPYVPISQGFLVKTVHPHPPNEPSVQQNKDFWSLYEGHCVFIGPLCPGTSLMRYGKALTTQTQTFRCCESRRRKFSLPPGDEAKLSPRGSHEDCCLPLDHSSLSEPSSTR